MSGPGFSPLPGGGEAAGFQAQFGTFLQLLTQIVKSLQGMVGPASPFTPYAFVAAGNLDVAATFPTLVTGTIVIRKTVPAALDVTLPGTGGPWIVADGAGVAAADHITVKVPGGFTINGGRTFVISTNWQAAILILDGTNYIANVL